MSGSKDSNKHFSFTRLLSGSKSRSASTSKSPTAQSGFLQGEYSYVPATQPTRRPNYAGMNPCSTPSNEPPPEYTPSPTSIDAPAAGVPCSAQNIVAQTDDDKYHFLTQIDTVFLIDDSGSMAGKYWREVAKALATIAPICTSRDPDGIDIYFLNARNEYRNVQNPKTVHEIFQTVQPSGGTPTGSRLRSIIRPYIAKLERDGEDSTKPVNIIVLTDGAPSDEVEPIIVWTAKKLDKAEAPSSQLGIQMLQIGREKEATEELQRLDNLYSGEDGPRDIVDTVSFTGADDEELTAEGILKVVLGSVLKRIDRDSNRIHQKR